MSTCDLSQLGIYTCRSAGSNLSLCVLKLHNHANAHCLKTLIRTWLTSYHAETTLCHDITTYNISLVPWLVFKYRCLGDLSWSGCLCHKITLQEGKATLQYHVGKQNPLKWCPLLKDQVSLSHNTPTWVVLTTKLRSTCIQIWHNKDSGHWIEYCVSKHNPLRQCHLRVITRWNVASFSGSLLIF